ncbi:MAG TPA: GAF domain-containing protein, partial [Stenomitos sp.]
GNIAVAREHLQEARELSEAGDARNPLHSAIASRHLGELALKEGDYPRAAREFEQAQAIVTRPEQDNLIEQGLLQRDLGELYLATQRPEEARAAFRAAGTIFHGLRNRHLLKPVSLRLEQLQQGLERTIEKRAPESPASPRWRQRLLGAADWRQEALEIGMTDFQASEATLLEIAKEALPVASRNTSGHCSPVGIPADWVSRALAEGKAVTFVELPEEDSESQGTQLDVTFVSVLIGPVMVDRQIVGALCLVKQEGTFEPEDVERLEELNKAVSALWAQTASRQTVRGVTLDEELRRTFHAHSCGSSSDLIKTVMEEWAAQLGLDDLAILIGDEISLSVSRAPQETRPIALDHDVVTEAYGSGKCVLGSGEIHAGKPPWVAVCPIGGGGPLKGALYCVRWGAETPLSEDDVPYIETCAELLGGAVAALSIK